MAAVDTTYDITGVLKLTGEAVAVVGMAQNMSIYPCAIWFQDAQPDPAVTPPDIVWGGGAYEEAFPNPKPAATEMWGAPAGNAPFTRMKIIHAIAA